MRKMTKVFALIFQPLFVIFVSGYDPNKQPIVWLGSYSKEYQGISQKP